MCVTRNTKRSFLGLCYMLLHWAFFEVGGWGEFPKHALVTSLGFYAALKSAFTKQHLPTPTSNVGVKMNKGEAT